MSLSRNWRSTAPIFLGGAQSLQSPCKLRPSLADFVSRSQIRSALPRNCAHNSNDKNPAPGAPQAVPVATERLWRPPLALFPFAQGSDLRCDTSNRGPMPVRQRLLQSPDRVSLPVQKVARPFLCRREICPDALTNRELAQMSDRLRHFWSAYARSAPFPLVTISLAIRARFFVRGRFESRTHRSSRDRNLP